MTRATCPACAEMKTNAQRKHSSAELQAYHPLRFDYEKATSGLPFTKVFNGPLEDDIRDPLATIGQRVWSYYLRMSWGNYCLYCVAAPEGDPVGQVDCAAALNLERKPDETDAEYKNRGKALVSKATAYFEKRGRLRREGRLIYPLLKPAPPPIVTRSGYFPGYKTFVEQWKVTHSTTFDELEVARSTVKRIRKVILSEYKRLRAPATKTGAYKEESSESHESVKSQAPPPPASSAPPDGGGILPIHRAFEPIRGGITDSAARRLIRDCGGATPDEIGDRATEELATIIDLTNVTNGVGLIIDRLRKFFHSPDKVKQWRRDREDAVVKQAESDRRREELRRQLEEWDAQQEEKARGGGAS